MTVVIKFTCADVQSIHDINTGKITKVDPVINCKPLESSDYAKIYATSTLDALGGAIEELGKSAGVSTSFTTYTQVKIGGLTSAIDYAITYEKISQELGGGIKAQIVTGGLVLQSFVFSTAITTAAFQATIGAAIFAGAPLVAGFTVAIGAGVLAGVVFDKLLEPTFKNIYTGGYDAVADLYSSTKDLLENITGSNVADTLPPKSQIGFNFDDKLYNSKPLDAFQSDLAKLGWRNADGSANLNGFINSTPSNSYLSERTYTDNGTGYYLISKQDLFGLVTKNQADRIQAGTLSENDLFRVSSDSFLNGGGELWADISNGTEKVTDLKSVYLELFGSDDNGVGNASSSLNSLANQIKTKYAGSANAHMKELVGDANVTDVHEWKVAGVDANDAIESVGGTAIASTDVQVIKGTDGTALSLISDAAHTVVNGVGYAVHEVVGSVVDAATAVGTFISDQVNEGVKWFGQEGGIQSSIASWFAANLSGMVNGTIDVDDALIDLAKHIGQTYLTDFIPSSVTNISFAKDVIQEAVEIFGVVPGEAALYANSIYAALGRIAIDFAASGGEWDTQQLLGAGIGAVSGAITATYMLNSNLCNTVQFSAGQIGAAVAAVTTAIAGIINSGDYDAGDWAMLGAQTGIAAGAAYAGTHIASIILEASVTSANPLAIAIAAVIALVGNTVISKLFGSKVYYAGEFGDPSLVINSIYTIQKIDDGTGKMIDALIATNGNGSTVLARGITHIIGAAGEDVLVDQAGVDSYILGNAGSDYLEGRKGKDALIGGDGNDILNGGEDDDILQGDAGDDTIFGEEGNDIVIAGAGDDFVHLGSGEDIANGGAGADYILASMGNDAIAGEDGNDMLDGGEGDDSIDGGAGDDIILGNLGNDSIAGGDGVDIIFGAEDNDTIYGGAGNDFIDGGEGIDILNGENGNDLIVGGAGDDFVDGGLGNDNIMGDTGNDVLLGGMDDDYLDGGEGDDTESGGFGNDILVGGLGADTLAGDDGDDVYVVSENAADKNNIISDTAGSDTLLLSWLNPANAANLSLVKNGGSLDVTYSGRKLATINDQFASADSAVEKIELAGGKYINLSAVNYNAATGVGAFSVATLASGSVAGMVAARASDIQNDMLSKELYFNDSFLEHLSQIAYDEKLGQEIDNEYYNGTGVTSFYRNRGLFGGKYTVYKLDQPGNITGNDAGIGYFALDGNASDQNLAHSYGMGTVDLQGAYDDLYLNADFYDMVVAGAGDIMDIVVDGQVVFSRQRGSGVYYAPGATINGYSFNYRQQFASHHFKTAVATKEIGNDLLVGAYWNETLDGKSGDDILISNSGDDALIGGTGDDWVLAGEGNDNAQGGDGADTIFGNGGNDTLSGGAGDDAILGAEGNDIINGDGGNDWLDGNTGNDTLNGGDGNDIVRGGLGNDTVSGGTGNDILHGDDGDDLLIGGDGDDRLYGGAGNDSLEGGAGNDILDGGGGASSFNGGEGIDRISFKSSTVGMTIYVDQVMNTSDKFISIEGIEGTDFQDNIIGSALQSNTLYGLNGNDTITGGAIADDLYGDVGNDTLNGGTGNDLLHGGRDNDVLNGGDGDDVLEGGSEGDTLNGGNGSDTVSYANSAMVHIHLASNVGNHNEANGDVYNSIENAIGSGQDDEIYGSAIANILSGGRGNDLIKGDAGNDTLNGDDGNDTLYGEAGDDTLNGGAGDDVLDGGAGVNIYNGGEGIDRISFKSSTTSMSLNVAAALSGTVSVEGVEGTNYNDIITGSAGNDMIYGGEGEDTINAGDGDDMITGGWHKDAINGGNGIDTVRYDDLTNEGVDVYLYNAPGSVAGNHGTANNDSYISIENIIGSKYGDNLFGNSESNVIYGGDGGDNMDGNEGNDTLYGEEGNDTIKGGIGNDTLEGGAGNDNIEGQDGDDIIIGGAGSDYLNGGAGFDTTSYAASAAGVLVYMYNTTCSGGDAEGDLVTNVERLIGSAFNDVIHTASFKETIELGNGDDTIVINAGGDTMDGGAGSDTLSYVNSAAVSVNLATNVISGGFNAQGASIKNFENIIGSGSSDTLIGDDNANVIQGGGGADTMSGGLGNDTLSYAASSSGVTVNLATNTASGGHAQGDIISGFENIIGSTSADTLTGTATVNNIAGGAGDDIITGGAGADILSGGDGSDRLNYAASIAGVIVNLTTNIAHGGDAEGDQISSFERITGSDFDDILIGTTGNNFISGGAGNDLIDGGNDTIDGGTDPDALDGGAGIDTVTYENSTRVDVDLNSTGNNGDANGDSYISIENVIGSKEGDTLIGTNGANVLNGGDGNDKLYGQGGDDLLIGGVGADELDGGAGVDTVSYIASTSEVYVLLSRTTAQSRGDAAGDILSNFENVIGSNFNDIIKGNDGNNILRGEGGDDNILGDNGADTLDGGDGVDYANYNSSTARVIVNLATGTASGGIAEGDTLQNIENILATSYDDILTGDSKDNILVAGAGNDILKGGTGNDQLSGQEGNDVIYGDEGADVIAGQEGSDTATYIDSTAGVNITFKDGYYQGKGGFAEGDTLYTIETLIGSAFDDALESNDLVIKLDGGAGNDTISYANSNAGVSVNLATNAVSGGYAASDIISNFENILGSAFGDTLTGNTGNNVLNGGAGDDTVTGGAGADIFVVSKEAGASDTITDFSTSTVGEKIDLRGFSTAPTFSQLSKVQSGSHTIITLEGHTITLHVMATSLTAAHFTGLTNEVIGTAGNDSLLYGTPSKDLIQGLGGHDGLYGFAGDDILEGGDGNDTLYGGAGADRMDGGSGNDIASYSDSNAGVNVNLTQMTAQSGGDAQGDILVSIENLQGSNFNDTLTGNGEANNIYGLDGDDVLTAGAGNDVILGGGGNDTINGGDGDDMLEGNLGADRIDGGAGVDMVYYGDSTVGVNVNLAQSSAQTGGTAEGDILTNVEHIAGSAYADRLVGNAAANIITGGAGDDYIEGGAGADVIVGGEGTDTASYATSAEAVTVDLSKNQVGGDAEGDSLVSIENINGSAGADTLTGNAGVNTIDGGAGNDTLDGGLGNDTLIGGAGADIFVIQKEANVNVTITDFSTSTTGEKIDLRGFTGAVGFSQLSKVQSGSHTIMTLQGYTLTLQNVTATALTAAHFAGLTNEVIGTAGNDTLTGTAANDIIQGLGGDDIIAGGSGADIIDGGDGIDSAYYYYSLAAVNVNLALTTAQSGGEAQGDVLSNIENILGSAYDDTLTGNAVSNWIEGGTGNDIINGGAGDDVLIGGTGADTIDGGIGIDTAYYYYSSTAVNVNLALTTAQSGGEAQGDVLSNIENILGSGYDDTLTGNSGVNTIDGSIGNDTLDGGTGNDTLTGGAGADIFVIQKEADANDTITDFSTSTTGEKIELRGFTAAPTFANLNKVQSGADTIIALEGHTITLKNVMATALTAAHFLGLTNEIIGTPGNDTLTGTAGDDIIEGLAGADIMDGGLGNDTVSYATSNAAVNINIATNKTSGGHALGDVISNFEHIIGSNFNDVLTGNTGANVLTGGTGNDSLTGGAGADTLDGGAGVDTLIYSASTAAVNVSLTTNTASGGEATGDVISGIENVTGSKYNDTLTGNALANILLGGIGNDTLSGEAGDDTLDGGVGADAMDGGAGIDTITYLTSTAAVTVNLATGAASGGDAAGDTLSAIENVTGSKYNDMIIGNAEANLLLGALGNDNIAGGAGADVIEGGAGADVMDGGADNDTLSYATSTAALIVSLAANTASGGDATGDIISGFENITGSKYDDTLTGNAGANIIIGGAGMDILIGGAGADTLDGGAGVDTVSYLASTAAVIVNLTITTAQAGGDAAGDLLAGIENIIGSNYDDMLTGSSGANNLNGGAGNDTVSYANSTAAVKIDLSLATAQAAGGYATGDILSGIENIIGTNFHDILTGSSVANNINGGAGNDTVSYANSTAAVNVDLSLVTAQSGGYAAGDILLGIESLIGSNFHDTMTGSSVVNNINGGAGDDILAGGAGADRLTGGLGLDKFKYTATTDSGIGGGLRDIITDFTRSQGDLIDLSAFTGTFGFKGTSVFSGLAPQINYAQASGNTIIGVDANGDNALDFQIELTGLHTLVASDFVL